jgi:hypothetical protein
LEFDLQVTAPRRVPFAATVINFTPSAFQR